jgi:hypothetical protein
MELQAQAHLVALPARTARTRAPNFRRQKRTALETARFLLSLKLLPNPQSETTPNSRDQHHAKQEKDKGSRSET